METNELELKIYRFSVNVFSFVKSLDKLNVSKSLTKDILNSSNLLYSKFLEYVDTKDRDVMSKLEECVKISLRCFELFKNADFNDVLLNEKVDLTIEASEISKILLLLLR